MFIAVQHLISLLFSQDSSTEFKSSKITNGGDINSTHTPIMLNQFNQNSITQNLTNSANLLSQMNSFVENFSTKDSTDLSSNLDFLKQSAFRFKTRYKNEQTAVKKAEVPRVKKQKQALSQVILKRKLRELQRNKRENNGELNFEGVRQMPARRKVKILDKIILSKRETTGYHALETIFEHEEC